MSRYVVIPLLILALVVGTILYGERTIPAVMVALALVAVAAGVKLWHGRSR